MSALPEPPEPVIKQCGCGRTYTAAQWQQLGGRLVGEMFGEVLEYRQCPSCRSHITIVLHQENEDGPASGVRPQ